MSPETNSSDRTKIRGGLIFLIMGVVLLLWAWGSWVYRTSEPDVAPFGIGTNAVQPAADHVSVGSPLSPLAVFGSLLVLLFLAVLIGYILVRARRRTARDADIQQSMTRALEEE